MDIELTDETIEKVESAKKAASKRKAAAKKARAVMKRWGVTLGYANGRRCIYADNVPQDALDEIRKALRDDLI